MEKATWLVCTGIQANRASGNLLDFLIRWLKTAKNINDNFRFWIICEGIDALTLTTVQKCCSNFLGNEGSDEFKDVKDGEIPISAFAEAKERYYVIDKFLIFFFTKINLFLNTYLHRLRFEFQVGHSNQSTTLTTNQKYNFFLLILRSIHWIY